MVILGVFELVRISFPHRFHVADAAGIFNFPGICGNSVYLNTLKSPAGRSNSHVRFSSPSIN